jgi:hypothetical protein
LWQLSFESRSDPFQGFGLLNRGFELRVHYRQNLSLVRPLLIQKLVLPSLESNAGKGKRDSKDRDNDNHRYENSHPLRHYSSGLIEPLQASLAASRSAG